MPALVSNQTELANAIETPPVDRTIWITTDFLMTKEIKIYADELTIESVPGSIYTIFAHIQSPPSPQDTRHFEVEGAGDEVGTTESFLTLRNIILDGSGDSGGISCLGTLRILEGTTIQNCDFPIGGAVNIGLHGSLIMDSGVLQNNNSSYGGAVNNQGNFYMRGGTIHDNQAGHSGGGIWSYENSFVMTGGTIHNNETLGDGGGIYAYSGILQISGDNCLNISGCQNESCPLSFNACSELCPAIYNNRATGDGGGIFVGGDAGVDMTATLNCSLIENNSATNGGGIYGSLNSTIQIAQSGIYLNEATNGGGIYLHGSSRLSLLSNVEITHNQAHLDGGGIFTEAIEDYGNLITDCSTVFCENLAVTEAITTKTAPHTCWCRLSKNFKNSLNNYDINYRGNWAFNPVKTASEPMVVPGATLSYIISDRNTGTLTAPFYRVEENLPTGAILKVPPSPTARIILSDGTVLSVIPTLPWTPFNPIILIEQPIPEGAEIQITFEVTTSSNQVEGPLVNTAWTFVDDDDTGRPATAEVGLIGIGTPEAPLSDIWVNKIPVENEVYPGQSVYFKIIVGNNGPDDSPSVTWIDNPHSDLSNPEISYDEGQTWEPWTKGDPIHLGPLAVGEQSLIIFKADSDDRTLTPVTNSVVAFGSHWDPDWSNNQDTASISLITVTPPPITLPEASDLWVSKAVGATTAVINQIVTYTLTIGNNGPADSPFLILHDPTPSQLENVEYNDGTGWKPWLGYLILPQLDFSQTLSVQIRGRITSNAASLITNVAAVHGPLPDPLPENNLSLVRIAVVDAPPIEVPEEDVADLWIKKSVDKVTTHPADTVTYVISWGNNGPNPSPSGTIEDTVPVGFLNPEYSSDGVIWKPWTEFLPTGYLNPGEVSSIQIRGVIGLNAESPLLNSCSILGSLFDYDLTNNSASSQLTIGTLSPPNLGVPEAETTDLWIKKTASDSLFFVGSCVTYSLTVGNQGKNASPYVIVNDNLPNGLENPQYSLDQGETWSPWHGEILLEALAPQQQMEILLTATITDAPTIISNVAIISGPLFETDLSNNHAISTIEAIPRPQPTPPVATPPVNPHPQPTPPITTPPVNPHPQPTPPVATPPVNPHPQPTPPMAAPKSKVCLCKKKCRPSSFHPYVCSYLICVINKGLQPISHIRLIADPKLLTHLMYSLDNGHSWIPYLGGIRLAPLEAGKCKKIYFKGISPLKSKGKLNVYIQCSRES